MMLEIGHQTRGVQIVQEDFRRLMVYGQTLDDETGAVVAKFTPTAELASVARRWRLSQLREMFNYALNGLWALLTDWGIEAGGDYAPLPLSRLEDLTNTATFAEVPGMTATARTSTADFVERLRAAAEVTDSLDGTWNLTAALTEDAVFRRLQDRSLDRRSRLGLLLTLYALPLVRLWDPELPGTVGDTDWRPVAEGGAARVGMALALQQLKADARSHANIAGSLHRVLSNHVIAQHERVAINKLPDDTFRFRREIDRIRFYDQSVEFSRNNSRFDALSTTCAELGWTGFFDDDHHPLTDEGRRIREDGDLPTPGSM